MQAILDFIIIIFSISISTYPHFPLANAVPPNIQSPDHGLRGNESDYEALLAIKAQTSNDPNSVLSSWNCYLHFCSWKGVSCGTRHRHVVSLHFPSSNLGGILSPFIGNLSFLRSLDLSNNFFRGDIPRQISHLPRLRKLVLSHNSFEGRIPSNWSRCLNLNILKLDNNNLVGKIPTELASLPNLVDLTLAANRLSDRLEAVGIGNMTSSLRFLFLNDNHLRGRIPEDIGRLKNLFVLSLGNNILLSGTNRTIPTLLNLSHLYTIYLSNTNINGSLPQDLGIRLPRLSILYISGCSLIGRVPTSLSNLSELEDLDISVNSFMGSFYINGNNLPRLSYLNIAYAFSSGGEARDMSFVDTLANCTKLTYLVISGNFFAGIFPHSMLNISSSLLVLDLMGNQISGQLPYGLAKFVNLYAFDVQDNYFTGPIPTDVGMLEGMEHLDFSYNNFSGDIPSSLGNLTRLSKLAMVYNNLEGSIRRSLGNCHNLQKMYLDSNKLSGVLPVELFQASALILLSISQNNLQGPLPGEISSLMHLFGLDVSENNISGEIPSTIGQCASLVILVMAYNSISGSIPDCLGALKNIEILDLSYNNLSGTIPNYFSEWKYVSVLNLSLNALEGEVPTSGVFANTSIISVAGNRNLCGGVTRLHLPKCPQPRRLSFAVIMLISIPSCVLVVVLSAAFCSYFLYSSGKRKNTPSGSQCIKPLLEVSYHMLSRATDGFSSSNLIGVGGFGYVYKGILRQDVLDCSQKSLTNSQANKL